MRASVQILNERNGGLVSNGFDLNTHLVKQPSNHQLARLAVYTKDKTPEETAAEILQRVTKNP